MKSINGLIDVVASKSWMDCSVRGVLQTLDENKRRLSISVLFLSTSMHARGCEFSIYNLTTRWSHYRRLHSSSTKRCLAIFTQVLVPLVGPLFCTRTDYGSDGVARPHAQTAVF